MRPEEMFRMIQNAPYTERGLDVDYCIKQDEDEWKCFLIFQGSVSKLDWLNNFNFPARPYRNQERPFWVHRGYARAWKSCNDIIMDEFLKACGDEFQPVIIGHSCGGALALLAAEDMNYRTGKLPEVYTYGAPKCLHGKRTRQAVRGSCLMIKNYIHVNDIVPRLPPFPLWLHPNACLVGSRGPMKERFKFEKYHLIYNDFSLYV